MLDNRAAALFQRGSVVLLLIGLLGYAPAHAQAPTAQQVPGTTVSMTPPMGFVLAAEFTGFREREDRFYN
jgi:hypothetical protein